MFDQTTGCNAHKHDAVFAVLKKAGRLHTYRRWEYHSVGLPLSAKPSAVVGQPTTFQGVGLS